MATKRLLAVSDLHISHPDNRPVAESLHPHSEGDWLIVAGDIGEQYEHIAQTLELLASRFSKVIWSPGNHELWTLPTDPLQLCGEKRYLYLVEKCRSLGVSTPEDPFPIWEDEDGPVAIAPLFTLYDYSFRAPGAASKEESLRIAHASGVVCTDEFLLHPAPYAGRDDWCRDRIAYTESRLTRLAPSLRTVLVNHWPLLRHPTRILHYPEFAQWCGTSLTADWHHRFRAKSVVYGHLHIPRVTWHDGVRFEEVSVGYPREWRQRPRRDPLRQILPIPEDAPGSVW